MTAMQPMPRRLLRQANEQLSCVAPVGDDRLELPALHFGWVERSETHQIIGDGLLLRSTHGLLCMLAALGVVLVLEKGQLFRPHHTAVQVRWLSPSCALNFDSGIATAPGAA
jgi:hypothetical protein